MSAQEYKKMMALSSSASEDFWRDAAARIDWFKAPERIHSEKGWFADGEVNMCWNAVDRHVEAGLGAQVALVHDSPVTGSEREMTFDALLEEVQLFSGVLAARGVGKGDRVVIYMPMMLEAMVAMLSCARLGAVHSVVFGGFAPKELAVRIEDAQPKVVVTASCGVEPSRVVPYKPLVEEALSLCTHQPVSVVVKQRNVLQADLKTEFRDEDWDAAMGGAKPFLECVSVKSTDPLYILYTSGTTGAPKGVVRDTGGYATALKWSMDEFMRVRAGETYWAASDIGWVVGHSYCVYGPLLQGCTSVVFEGKPVGTPDASAYWRVVDQYKVHALFTAPTALRAIRRFDPNGSGAKSFDISSLRTMFVAGERADPDTVRHFQRVLGKPVVDHYWQTESGWPIAGFQDEKIGTKPGSVSRALPGFDVRVLDEDSSAELGKENLGDLCVKLPLPPGALTTLYNASDRFKEAYLRKHPGFYFTGDAGVVDENDYVHVLSRTDDVINCAGHRLCTGALEEVLISHTEVTECAVIGVKDDLKGQVPVGFLVLAQGVALEDHPTIQAQVVKMVRDQVGPVASFKRALVVDELPKTRSGKILRKTMQSIAMDIAYNMPATIENPSALENIKRVVSEFKGKPT